MKRTLFMAGMAVVVMSFFMASCNSMKKLQQNVIETAVMGQVVPEQLESVNGVINFDYTVNFAPKEFHKKMILKITPKMQYGNNVEKLPPIFLQGENVKNSSYPVVAYKGATSFTQQMTMNFNEGMQNGVLWADIEAMMGDKSFMMTPVILNKNGVKVWQNYALNIGGVNYVPALTETFVEDIPAAQVGVVSGYVMFPLAKSVLTDQQKNSAIMKQAEQAMKKVWANKDVKITNMLIYTSSSPEGVERMNKNLTNNRFKAAKTFFEQQLGFANTPMAKDPKFVVSQLIDENWQGLYLLLGDSNIKNKAELIKELQAASNNKKREAILEANIKKIPELKDVILPILRRADFYVFYAMPEMIQDEVQLTYFIPQADEMSPAVPTQWNWQLLNDLAVVAIQNKDYAKAQKLLEAAWTLKQDAAVMNNLAIVYGQQGNSTKASDMLSKAQIRKEARYNMGLMLMKQGNYSKAIPYLKEMPNINLAYAQLMNNDNRAALDTFKKLKLTNATEYYMMAVAAARVKDAQDMAMALQKAIQMNSKLKQWAATDVEFYPYKGNPVFMQIVK